MPFLESGYRSLKTTTFNWEIAVVGHCPICSQGNQWVACEKATNNLFVYCHECEAEWDSPADARESSLSSRDKYGPCRPVRVEDLREHPWFTFVLNKGVLADENG
jgi:hypothetical protein